MTEDVGELVEAAGRTAPFLLEVEEQGLYLARFASVVVVGQVLRGAVTVGEALDLVGFAPAPKPVVLRDMVADGAFLGGLPCYLLEGVTKQEIHHGQVLAAPGSLWPATTFRAEVRFYERHERLTQRPLQGICRYQFHIRHADVFSTLYLPSGKQQIVHDDRFTATIALTEPCALEVGLRFGIGRFLGQGRVVEVVS